jgi:GT2 family glycosyltransferase
MGAPSRFLVGIIYGGRASEFNALLCSLWDQTRRPFDLIVGVNRWDETIESELSHAKCLACPHDRRVAYFGKNIGHFPMANYLAWRAAREGYDYFVDVNDDVQIIQTDWLERIEAEFATRPDTALVSFEECVVNPADLRRDDQGLTSTEFASACFAVSTEYVVTHGLFDPRFFWYCGDSDLGWMARRVHKKTIGIVERGWIKHDFRCGRDLNLGEEVAARAEADSKALYEKWDDPEHPR